MRRVDAEEHSDRVENRDHGAVVAPDAEEALGHGHLGRTRLRLERRRAARRRQRRRPVGAALHRVEPLRKVKTKNPLFYQKAKTFYILIACILI